jgi:hypothetical protein
MMDHAQVSETDIVRARQDPRFRQILLARSLEQLLGSLHRMQHGPLGADSARDLRQGALMAVELADRIRVIDDNLR